MAKKYYKVNYLQVSKGDIVEVGAGFMEQKTLVFKALVLEVVDRYTLMDFGRRFLPPLLKVKNLFTREVKSYDITYVKSIINKYKGPKRIADNFFRDTVTEYDKQSVKTKSKGISCGPLSLLTSIALSRLPFELKFDIDIEKLAILFNKQKPGLVKAYYQYGVYIRNKPFEKWVRKNAYRICKTAKEVLDENTKHQTEYEEDYWTDYEDRAEASY